MQVLDSILFAVLLIGNMLGLPIWVCFLSTPVVQLWGWYRARMHGSAGCSTQRVEDQNTTWEGHGIRACAPLREPAGDRTPGFDEVIQRLQALLSSSRPCLRLRHVLVPITFTERSLRALQYALCLARQFGSTITLLHVVQLNIVGEERGVPRAGYLDEMKLAAERRLHEIVSFLDMPTARVVVLTGEPVAAILQEAIESGADVILIGRPQRRGLRRLLGPSVGRRVMCRSSCPTLIAP